MTNRSTNVRSLSRGRPRGFDDDAVRDSIVMQFWAKGFAGTSLDELAAATGLKRGSLYGAFGNKQAMYLDALDRFAGRMRHALELAEHQPDVRKALRTFFAGAVAEYTASTPNLGCMVFCTAPAATVEAAAVADRLAAITAELDIAMTDICAKARDGGQLAPAADPPGVGRLLTALLQSVALRARAGAAASDLDAFVETSLDCLPWLPRTER